MYIQKYASSLPILRRDLGCVFRKKKYCFEIITNCPLCTNHCLLLMLVHVTDCSGQDVWFSLAYRHIFACTVTSYSTTLSPTFVVCAFFNLQFWDMLIHESYSVCSIHKES